MFKILGKQTATQGWQEIGSNYSEGQAISDADQKKAQGVYQYVKVVDSDGSLCYTA